MKDEFVARVGLCQPFVDLLIRPELLQLWFAFDGVGPLIKAGHRQEDSLAVFAGIDITFFFLSLATLFLALCIGGEVSGGI